MSSAASRWRPLPGVLPAAQTPRFARSSIRTRAGRSAGTEGRAVVGEGRRKRPPRRDQGISRKKVKTSNGGRVGEQMEGGEPGQGQVEGGP